MKISIVGGAIGGLFAANALVRRGIESAACAPEPNPPRLSARVTVVLPYA